MIEKWYLPIQCPWRIESLLPAQVIAASDDWFDPVDEVKDGGEDWKPTRAEAYQNRSYPNIFEDPTTCGHLVVNHNANLEINDAQVSAYGDLVLALARK